MSEFQKWMTANDYTDVRFYPINIQASSTVEILNSAMSSVKAYEDGKSSNYTDNVETFLSAEEVKICS